MAECNLDEIENAAPEAEDCSETFDSDHQMCKDLNAACLRKVKFDFPNSEDVEKQQLLEYLNTQVNDIVHLTISCEHWIEMGRIIAELPNLKSLEIVNCKLSEMISGKKENNGEIMTVDMIWKFGIHYKAKYCFEYNKETQQVIVCFPIESLNEYAYDGSRAVFRVTCKILGEIFRQHRCIVMMTSKKNKEILLLARYPELVCKSCGVY
ncbi:hypothetical protein CHUAL_009916 [Chamberlinius hualienensis]